MNSQAGPVSTVHIHANYHDDFDGAAPLTPAERAAAEANGTLTASGKVANETNCTSFQNGTLDELETNFTALFQS
jgi:hypothetical protein